LIALRSGAPLIRDRRSSALALETFRRLKVPGLQRITRSQACADCV